ncbi:uncharacterized protein PG998_013850 [Apiospora kogelbergensis]|uniref:uncharacterized protein n=1 Tax=Apiospora kogelbergensis TaxID=1337665 RepID=UPI003130D924
MASSTSSSDPIVFYDIASGPPVHPFAPNPWKARYALNFKCAHFTTEWVDLADVTSVRKRLGADPPFYTLPLLKDPSADNTVVGDSFDIAVYLERKYSEAPSLFPNASSIGLYASFNAHMDNVFPMGAALASQGMPFNPETEEQCKAEFCRRMGGQDVRRAHCARRGAEEDLGRVSEFLGRCGQILPVLGWPFHWGQKADYADIIIGGWLMMFCETVPEWNEIREWHGGLWGKLHDALKPYRGTW